MANEVKIYSEIPGRTQRHPLNRTARGWLIAGLWQSGFWEIAGGWGSEKVSPWARWERGMFGVSGQELGGRSLFRKTGETWGCQLLRAGVSGHRRERWLGLWFVRQIFHLRHYPNLEPPVIQSGNNSYCFYSNAVHRNSSKFTFVLTRSCSLIGFENLYMS